MVQGETIVAVATPPGNGGLAVVRLSGATAVEVAEKVFKAQKSGRTLADMPGYTAAYGNFYRQGQVFDDGVALLFRTPHSYTGEDVVELSCHGGQAVAQQLVTACIEAGAQPAHPGEYTRRAFLNGRLNLTQAEAVLELVSTTTATGVAAANAAMRGTLFKKIEELKQQLVTLAGHLAAYVDFPEEDVDALTPQAFIETVRFAGTQLEQLIMGYEQGAILRRGVRAAVVGSPNVGKSTLFNLLSGFDRAIVTPVSGTTRDVVREQIQVGGIPLLLSDTAGLHDTEDLVESEGIKRSYDEIEQAGLVIAVFDGSQPLTREDEELLQRCAGRPALGIINKDDLETTLEPRQLQPFFTKVVRVSALQKKTRNIIEKSVIEVLGLQTVDADSTLLANERQLAAAVAARDALHQAEQALQQGYTLDAAGVCLDDALNALASLTGENASDAVIDDLFARFCVGK